MANLVAESDYKLLATAEQQKSFEVKHIDKVFYSGIRNEINPARLNKMSRLAKNIQMPSVYGVYEDDSHYAMTLELMLNSTEETRHRGAFLLRKILPMLSQKYSLLDVGAGNGQIMSWIGNHFKHVTAIDTNKEEITQLNSSKKLLKKEIQLNKIHGSILSKLLPFNFYNLSLLSHVLYYLPRNQWLNAIDMAYATTKDNGIIFIALSGDNLGKAKLIQHYNGVYINIDSIARQCINKFGAQSVEVFSSEEIITTKDLHTMLHIAGFFLCDANALAEKNSLIEYLNTHCKKNDNSFCMTTEQKFIIIQKNV